MDITACVTYKNGVEQYVLAESYEKKENDNAIVYTTEENNHVVISLDLVKEIRMLFDKAYSQSATAFEIDSNSAFTAESQNPIQRFCVIDLYPTSRFEADPGLRKILLCEDEE